MNRFLQVALSSVVVDLVLEPGRVVLDLCQLLHGTRTRICFIVSKVLGKKIMGVIVTSLVPVYTFGLSHLRRNPLLPCLHCLQRLP